MLAVENEESYLIGDSHVEWDHAVQRDVDPVKPFAHYENRHYPEAEANETFAGKCNRLIADGYVFEVYPDMRHFVRTGVMQYKVHKH